ncbi:tryptophan synthase subunit alpha [Candidatus Nitrosotenuis sp. DW1]|uniref:tryptophan synthase subunit alpha n=1 Tax=Candidatus Nitrosotenuis sp. DW1 TaxID=2259672 RepID=UPI00210437EF|nr:tryptophan synthase subunit alpha [Candidatus Nitrosotenuis sp. DW1]
MSTPEDVRHFIKQGADAVIIGSALIKLVEKTPTSKLEKTVTEFTKKLKSTTKIS